MYANARHRSPTRRNFHRMYALCNARGEKKTCKIFHRPEFHKLPSGGPCPRTLIAIELHVECIVRPVEQRKHPPASYCRRDGNVWGVLCEKLHTVVDIFELGCKPIVGKPGVDVYFDGANILARVLILMLANRSGESSSAPTCARRNNFLVFLSNVFTLCCC